MISLILHNLIAGALGQDEERPPEEEETLIIRIKGNKGIKGPPGPPVSTRHLHAARVEPVTGTRRAVR